MKTNKAMMILAALLALCGCGPVEPTARDVDELAMRHRSEAAPAWDAATGGEATWGDRLWAAGYLAGRKGHTA